MGGSMFDMANLESLCHACHSRKTMYIESRKLAKAPVKGCSKDGMPLDPEHWWGHGA